MRHLFNNRYILINNIYSHSSFSLSSFKTRKEVKRYIIVIYRLFIIIYSFRHTIILYSMVKLCVFSSLHPHERREKEKNKGIVLFYSSTSTLHIYNTKKKERSFKTYHRNIYSHHQQKVK